MAIYTALLPLRPGTQALYVMSAEIKSEIEPNCVLEDFGRESVALVYFCLSHGRCTGRFRVNLSVPITTP